MFCHVYVSSSSEVVEGCIAPNRCAEANILERDSRRFENSIMGSGHTFPNAAEFRDAVYLMSIAGRFRYRFKRNSSHFHNHHNHSLEDVAACQPLVRSNRASLLIDDVIQSTPDYQPHQICKDFQRQHGMQLTYLQAWNIKEKANECIYGEPNIITNCCLGCVRKWLQQIQEALLSWGIQVMDILSNSLLLIRYLSKKVVGDKEVVIISDRHPALLRSVPEVFGLENHAYCYRHLKENFSSFLSKHNTRGNKGKENALQFLDSIAYARNERHHSICTFLMEHMAKLGSMLVKHKEESNNWKECIGPKIEEKVQQKIAKGEVYPVTPFMNGIFGVSIGTTFLNVDIMKRTCTYWYKFPMQELIYSGSFSGIETHDMPMVANDGLVRSITGEVFLSLNPPHTKRPPADQERSALSPNFKINGLSLAQDVILPGTTGKRARTLCLKCNAVTFFHD
ncbi:hypothetical protein CK203_108210 [Vitis vinifera]|uniref:Transposase MuDR plant domain-containing protein n=1 Tax=Vitis vinifera TaxID=29760 RepID=A0A438CEU1_VITVI|nr:hypothetical protein CK203_108210 [Vitis vinifera]